MAQKTITIEGRTLVVNVGADTLNDLLREDVANSFADATWDPNTLTLITNEGRRIELEVVPASVTIRDAIGAFLRDVSLDGRALTFHTQQTDGASTSMTITLPDAAASERIVPRETMLDISLTTGATTDNSPVQLDLANLSGDHAEQGITLSSNALNFATAGDFRFQASLHFTIAGGTAGSDRTDIAFYVTRNGTEIEYSRDSIYHRGTSRAGLDPVRDSKVDVEVLVEAGDVIRFFVEPDFESTGLTLTVPSSKMDIVSGSLQAIGSGAHTEAEIKAFARAEASTADILQVNDAGDGLEVTPASIEAAYLDGGNVAKKKALRDVMDAKSADFMRESYRERALEDGTAAVSASQRFNRPFSSDAALLPVGDADEEFQATLTNTVTGDSADFDWTRVSDLRAKAAASINDQATSANALIASDGTDNYYLGHDGAGHPLATSDNANNIRVQFTAWRRTRLPNAYLAPDQQFPDSPAQGQVPTYDESTKKWTASTPTAGEASEIDPLSAAPSKTGKDVGTLVNVGGDILELAAQTDGANVLQGVAAALADNYFGVNTIDRPALGSFADPDVSAIWEWTQAEGQSKARLKAPKAAFAGSPPASFFAVASEQAGWGDFQLSRWQAGDTATHWAWQAPTTGEEISGGAGDAFSVAFWTRITSTDGTRRELSGPINIHTADRWENWLQRNRPPPTPYANIPGIPATAAGVRNFAKTATTEAAARAGLGGLLNASAVLDYSKALLNLPIVTLQGDALPAEDTISDWDAFSLRRQHGDDAPQFYRARPLGLSDEQAQTLEMVLNRTGSAPNYTWTGADFDSDWRIGSFRIVGTATQQTWTVGVLEAHHHLPDEINIALSGDSAQFPLGGSLGVSKRTAAPLTETIAGRVYTLYDATLLTPPSGVRAQDVQQTIRPRFNVDVRPRRRWEVDLTAEEIAQALNAQSYLDRRAVHNIDQMPVFDSREAAHTAMLETEGTLDIQKAIENDGTLVVWKDGERRVAGMVIGQQATGGTAGPVNRRNRIIVTMRNGVYDRSEAIGSRRSSNRDVAADNNIFLERAVLSSTRIYAPPPPIGSGGYVNLQTFTVTLRDSVYSNEFVILATRSLTAGTTFNNTSASPLVLRRIQRITRHGLPYSVYQWSRGTNPIAAPASLELVLTFFEYSAAPPYSDLNFEPDLPAYTNGYTPGTNVAIAELEELGHGPKGKLIATTPALPTTAAAARGAISTGNWTWGPGRDISPTQYYANSDGIWIRRGPPPNARMQGFVYEVEVGGVVQDRGFAAWGPTIGTEITSETYKVAATTSLNPTNTTLLFVQQHIDRTSGVLIISVQREAGATGVYPANTVLKVYEWIV